MRTRGWLAGLSNIVSFVAAFALAARETQGDRLKKKKDRVALVALVISIVSLLGGGFNFYWSELRVAEELKFTPIEVFGNMDFDIPDHSLGMRFALANTGTDSAILTHLCLFPKKPPTGFGLDVVGGGASWRLKPGSEVMHPIVVPPKELVYVEVYFDSPSGKPWGSNGTDKVDVDLIATVLDREGTPHIRKIRGPWITLGPGKGEMTVRGSPPPTLLLQREVTEPDVMKFGPYCLPIGAS